MPLSGPVLTAAEMRSVELASGVPLDELMERAGSALAEAVLRFGTGAPVLVLCGPGNNGGDGYVAACLLAAQGIDVAVAVSGEPMTGLSRAVRALWKGEVSTLSDATARPVLVDALFGSGLSRPLDDNVRDQLARMREGACLTIAADLPSGLGTDDGAALGTSGADITLAFGAVKPAHLLQPAATLCGRVLVADIGIAAASDVTVLERPRLPPPGPADHKYTRGMVAVVPGTMAGAATLGVSAAARIAGYTVLCGKGDAPASVVRRGFEAVLGDPKLGAMLIGPGLADTPEARDKLSAALASDVPLVLDAGALALIDADLDRTAPTVLTPHDGEFTRLFGDVPGSKIDRARGAAARSGATIVFKGSDTVIASPEGRVTLAPAASAWLASAGTGDVLAGILAALLARGLDAHEAACAGVWLHAEAARRAGLALVADDLPAHLPAAFAMCA